MWRAETDEVVSAVVDRLVGSAASAKGVVIVDGDHVYVRAFGHRQHDPPKPFTESTRFEIGSVSKVFAGLLLADAVVRGEVGLADPLERHLPDIYVKPYPDTPITLLDVGSQAVGFSMMPDNWKNRGRDLSRPEYTMDLLRDYLARFEHPFRPGSGYSYSNVSTALLAMALSRRTGKNYERLLQERIFEPLGMRNSDFASTPVQTDDALEGWGEGERFLPRVDGSPLAPCCVVRSNLTDIVPFLRAAAGLSDVLQRAFDTLGEPRHRIDNDGLTWATLGWVAYPRENVLWKNGVSRGQLCVMAVWPGKHRALFFIENDESVDVDRVGSALARGLFHQVLDLEQAAHARFVVESVPSDTTAADATFENAMRVVAWNAPARLQQGEVGRVRFYFRSLAPADRDWRIFVHVDRRGAARERIRIDHYPGSGADSTALWKPGETVIDEFAIVVPEDARLGTYDMWFGFYDRNTRAEALSPTTRVDSNRVLGPTIVIEGAAKKKAR